MQIKGHLLRFPLTWHPLGNLVTDKSTSPADKFPEGAGRSRLFPGHCQPSFKDWEGAEHKATGLCLCWGVGATLSGLFCLGPAGLVLRGPLHSKNCVHSCWLPLRVAEGLLLTVLLGPCACPESGSQTVGPGQWVQAW